MDGKRDYKMVLEPVSGRMDDAIMGSRNMDWPMGKALQDLPME